MSAAMSRHPPTQLAMDGHTLTAHCAEATREEMSAAKLPLPYRDSCAHLLIPLNRCRYEEYYLPWKCEVRRRQFPTDAGRIQTGRLTTWLERATFIRKVPVRGVQGARQEDGRAEGSKGRRAKQLERRLMTVEGGNDCHERTPLHVYTEAAKRMQFHQRCLEATRHDTIVWAHGNMSVPFHARRPTYPRSAHTQQHCNHAILGLSASAFKETLISSINSLQPRLGIFLGSLFSQLLSQNLSRRILGYRIDKSHATF